MRLPEAIVAGFLAAASPGVEADAIAYAGMLGYSGDTLRRSARLAGAYVRLDGESTLECGWESTRIDVVGGPPIEQHDATVLLGLHPEADGTAILGAHCAWAPGRDDPVSRTALAIASERGPGGWWQGLSAAVSRFTVATPAVDVVQADPRIGWTWTLDGGISLDQWVHGSVAGLDRDPGLGRHHAISGEYGLDLRLDRIALHASGWSGSRCYHVGQRGFVVYDLPAEYRHGWSAGLSADLWRGTWIGVQAGSEAYHHLSATGEARVDRLVGMLGCVF